MEISKLKKLVEKTLNINKAKEILNWSPKYSIAQSIKLTVEWYKYVYINLITYSILYAILKTNRK